MLEFQPLYVPDRLELVNPTGDVGIVTLWTPLRTKSGKPGAGLRLIERLAPGALDPASSRVAVVSNLYGAGMFKMFCNLLFNPQIRYLIAIGEDMKLPTCAEIVALKNHGVEEATVLGRTVLRIPGTSRLLPMVEGFDVDRLREQFEFHQLGEFSDPGAAALPGLLASLPVQDAASAERLKIDIPPALADDYAYRPSNVAAHQVTRKGPLDCWEELVVRTCRFGVPVTLEGGPRLELLNTRVVITDPREDPADTLEQYGFSLDQFRDYQTAMLNPSLPSTISYTYGNRLRGHFDQGAGSHDTLETVIARLQRNGEARNAFISLWDSALDLPVADEGSAASPCLVTLCFRRSFDRLTLTATYRAHNLLTAWLENAYGLMAVQAHVADRVGVPVGPLSIVSHSLGIDPENSFYELAVGMSEAWTRDEDVDRVTGKHSLREDPNGYFMVTVDNAEGEIVAEHMYDGLLLKQYRSDSAAKIERQIIGDMAVSLPSHALWLGRELMTKEVELRARTRPRREPGVGR